MCIICNPLTQRLHATRVWDIEKPVLRPFCNKTPDSHLYVADSALDQLNIASGGAVERITRSVWSILGSSAQSTANITSAMALLVSQAQGKLLLSECLSVLVVWISHISSAQYSDVITHCVVRHKPVCVTLTARHVSMYSLCFVNTNQTELESPHAMHP